MINLKHKCEICFFGFVLSLGYSFSVFLRFSKSFLLPGTFNIKFQICFAALGLFLLCFLYSLGDFEIFLTFLFPYLHFCIPLTCICSLVVALAAPLTYKKSKWQRSPQQQLPHNFLNLQKLFPFLKPVFLLCELLSFAAAPCHHLSTCTDSSNLLIELSLHCRNLQSTFDFIYVLFFFFVLCIRRVKVLRFLFFFNLWCVRRLGLTYL